MLRFQKAIILVLFHLHGMGQETFEPPKIKQLANALQTAEDVQLDGLLEEDLWEMAEIITDFVQVEPRQGDPSIFTTEVQIVYNSKVIYIGVKCLDSLGKKGIRAPNLRRDFDFSNHDVFGITFDTFIDERNSQSFEVNPYGTLRDLLVTDGDNENLDWNAVWRVRTNISEKGWTAEIAIPWSTLRYPKGSTEWGVNFYRLSRRTNELSVWSPVPRSFKVSRMNYAGILKNLNPPPPSTNIQVQPYLLTQTENNSDKKDLFSVIDTEAGGEVKWAIGPNTVIDLTVNTDFAQAEVDRNVVNLTRFSVFFPERRQFFLENANLFSVGRRGIVQPFFSRSIGLDDFGNPVPLHAGFRLTHRDSKNNIGAMLIRQGSADDIAPTTFGVGRYSRNIGKQNRIGFLFTSAFSEALDAIPSGTNLTGSVDGFLRLSDPLSINFMLSKTHTSGSGGNGNAFSSRLIYNSNDIYSFLSFDYIDDQYNPEVGFLGRSNYYQFYPGFIYLLRPKWLPGSIRSYEPALFYDSIFSADDGVRLETRWSFYPIFISFQNGSSLSVLFEPTYQFLRDDFAPLGITIGPGEYNFNRSAVDYISDNSNKISWKLGYSWGDFYDGQLSTFSAGITLAPIPHTFLSVDYQYNKARDLGLANEELSNTLLTPELRVALNPRMQLQAFYQYQFDNTTEGNRLNEFKNWNIRFSWEFKPLSFFYLVFNDFDNELGTERNSNRQLIAKLTFLKQF